MSDISMVGLFYRQMAVVTPTLTPASQPPTDMEEQTILTEIAG